MLVRVKSMRTVQQRERKLVTALAKLGPLYTVCAYRKRERVLKETLSAARPEAAIAVGRDVLRARGFSSNGIRWTALRTSAQAVAKAVVKPLVPRAITPSW